MVSFDKQLVDLQKALKKYLLEKKLKEFSAVSPLCLGSTFKTRITFLGSALSVLPCLAGSCTLLIHTLTLTHTLTSQTDFRLSLSLWTCLASAGKCPIWPAYYHQPWSVHISWVLWGCVFLRYVLGVHYYTQHPTLLSLQSTVMSVLFSPLVKFIPLKCLKNLILSRVSLTQVYLWMVEVEVLSVD